MVIDVGGCEANRHKKCLTSSTILRAERRYYNVVEIPCKERLFQIAI